MLPLARFSFGVGDRFGHQAAAQLQAFQQLEQDGCLVIPVWNKSNREHTFIGSEPSNVRIAAEQAVHQCGWNHAWHVDADHIRLETVDRFIEPSDFFTIDVADSIGTPATDADLESFVARHPELHSHVALPGIANPLPLSKDILRSIARNYLRAVKEAGQIFRHIQSRKGADGFIAEVSMDETDQPQTPQDLLVILVAMADEGLALQTIAPKFTGRFNKGVDYVGDLEQFEREFLDDLSVIEHAIQAYGLPSNLKLSVHSGSDKFSLYPIIRRAIAARGAGLHIKTAGTTWLEELIGLAESGPEGADFVREIYLAAREKMDVLTAPYATVIDIAPSQLPTPNAVSHWEGSDWVGALRHDRHHSGFNPSLRQLLHVSFKLAALAGPRYMSLLEAHADVIARNVKENLFERHMKPLFLG
ncbi:MAG: tagaturonate epimerase family protein [Planctomycetota bacterium]|jgi:hypothetical protein